MFYSTAPRVHQTKKMFKVLFFPSNFFLIKWAESSRGLRQLYNEVLNCSLEAFGKTLGLYYKTFYGRNLRIFFK